MKSRLYPFRRLLALGLAVASLTVAGCDTSAEDVKIPSREILQERYGALALGTYEVRSEKGGRLTGTKVAASSTDNAVELVGADSLSVVTLYLSESLVEVDGPSTFDEVLGSYSGDPIYGRTCDRGRLDVLSATAEGVRAVFAVACGKSSPLLSPSDYVLVEGGFYLRRN